MDRAVQEKDLKCHAVCWSIAEVTHKEEAVLGGMHVSNHNL